jgi:hypothetical protein
MPDNYDEMRNEIRRLHSVCRAKDETIKKAVGVIKSMLHENLSNPFIKAAIGERIREIENTLG